MMWKRPGMVCPVNRSVTYRLYPTARQVVALDRLLESQRLLYNAALEERIGRWNWNREAVGKYDQFKTLTGARCEVPSLAEFGVDVHRGTLTRLDEAFAGFFRRVKAGRTPGFPRFKAYGRWDSVTIEAQQGWKVYIPEGRSGTYGRLRLAGVGHVQVKLHRDMGDAAPCKLVVRRRGRRWEATVFYKDVAQRPAPEPSGVAAGVDRGVTVLVAVAGSDGTTELVENPRHLRNVEADLARKQRRLARCQRGSNRRAKARAEVAELHRKVADARKDRNHQLSRRLVDSFDVIVLEDLKVANMVRRPAAKPDPDIPGGWLPNGAAAKAGLNRSIQDAGWGQLASMLTYKAAEAGREIVLVNPRHTSQTCSQCGHVDRGNRVGVKFECGECGHDAHADLNAALNLLDKAGISRLRPSQARASVKP